MRSTSCIVGEGQAAAQARSSAVARWVGRCRPRGAAGPRRLMSGHCGSVAGRWRAVGCGGHQSVPRRTGRAARGAQRQSGGSPEERNAAAGNASPAFSAGAGPRQRGGAAPMLARKSSMPLHPKFLKLPGRLTTHDEPTCIHMCHGHASTTAAAHAPAGSSSARVPARMQQRSCLLLSTALLFSDKAFRST